MGSVMMPISLGFVVTIAIFLLAFSIFKFSLVKATHLSLLLSLLVFIISIIIGSWLGMGIGVISLGMFLATILLYILNFTLYIKSK